MFQQFGVEHFGAEIAQVPDNLDRYWNWSQMPVDSHFLSAKRLPRSQILGQSRRFGDCAVLTLMLNTAPGMVALLNQERQIVFCNEACAEAGGLASKADALGMRPGELLRCRHATEMPGGCGASESCLHCGLLQALAIGQQGQANAGEFLLQCGGPDKELSAEYSVRVQPLPQLGAGWQCYSLADIGAEKRRAALERIFFHDIMNRAGAVEGVSRILAEEDLTAQERNDFNGMLSLSARALVEEIRSQRTLLAAEKGELAVENSDCDSLGALRNAAVTSQAFGSPVVNPVVILPGAQSILIQTDPTLLGRILVNLLKNAIEASSAGNVVTATCAETVPGRIRYSIHNDAVLPDHVRAHLFQRSFTTKGAGRGLGAYSIKLLTENYLDGRVWFESATGEGTTFHVEFAI